MTFKERIARHIAAEELLSPGARVVVGLSGGADSAALLAVLCALGYSCLAVHCHFGLRGDEADRDLDHSRELARRFGAEFRSVRFQTAEYMAAHGVSAEMACRELRYDYFEQLRLETGAEAIAVGHHREDNIETFFLNLLRGSGIHGLRGMLPRRGCIIRPLLCVSKAEILDYLRETGIDYITDSSNLSNDFKRNRLRNSVLPLLEREFPGAADAIERSLANLRGNEALYNSLMPERRDSLEGVSPTLLHEWLAPMGFNSDQCEQILQSASGAVFRSMTHRLTLCPGGRYILEPLGAESSRPRLSGRIVDRAADFLPRRGVLYLDADAVGNDARWELRPWKQGDRMRPFGMKGTKLVSDLLAEAGVPASHRPQSYVLTLGGDIVWAVGVRASALYPVTENTKRIIEIRHEKTDND
ncbi:MAG: tRNA lysidine(34) synthetase TilS [Muribaculaceae bacterium]|nr:tRNA lysidine(34) synthetase TilS [Muribaculaceae bacterium]